MGHQLTREVKAGALPAWTTNMRLVADAVADEANDRTRRTIGYRIEGYWRANGKGWRDGICEHTGLGLRQVQRALAALATAGFDLRVPICIGKDGRPVYGVRGRSADYLVPALTARPRPSRRPEASPDPTPFRPEASPDPTPFSAQRVSDSDTPSPQNNPLRQASPHTQRSLRSLPASTSSARGEGPVMTHSRNSRAPSPDQNALWPAPVPDTTGRELAPVAGPPPGFPEFWAVYPRHVAKRAGERAYRAALGRATAAVILAGARRYAEDPARLPAYTKHPATWLNGDCWADDPLPARPGSTATLTAGLRLAAQYAEAGD